MKDVFDRFLVMVRIIFISGWWKCSGQAMRTLLASIRIMPPYCGINLAAANPPTEKIQPIGCAAVCPRASRFAQRFAVRRGRLAARATDTQCTPPPTQPAAKTKPTAPAKNPRSLAPPLQKTRRCAAANPSASQDAANAKIEKQLSDLAHELNAHPTPANEQRLSQFETTRPHDEYGERAASRSATTSSIRAMPRRLCLARCGPQETIHAEEYAAYWHAQALRQTGRNDLALGELETFRKTFPDSVMIDLATQSYAEAAIMQGDPTSGGGAGCLPENGAEAFLLLLRAQAREKAGKLLRGGERLPTIYYGFR